MRAARGARLNIRSILAGVLLGALNFGNILSYVRAHQRLPHSPAIVFASMNLGVVVVGALVGRLGVAERLGLRGWLGLALAAPAIAAIAWGMRLA